MPSGSVEPEPISNAPISTLSSPVPPLVTGVVGKVFASTLIVTGELEVSVSPVPTPNTDELNCWLPLTNTSPSNVVSSRNTILASPKNSLPLISANACKVIPTSLPYGIGKSIGFKLLSVMTH